MTFEQLQEKVLRWAKDKHSWTSLGFCLVGAVVLYVANRVIDEKMEGEK